MTKFRKKPVVIEAMQYDGTLLSATRISKWMGLDCVDLNLFIDALLIDTLEGTMNASPGDWIIKGVAGEFYPCKPDIFAATYEPVDE